MGTVPLLLGHRGRSFLVTCRVRTPSVHGEDSGHGRTPQRSALLYHQCNCSGSVRPEMIANCSSLARHLIECHNIYLLREWRNPNWIKIAKPGLETNWQMRNRASLLLQDACCRQRDSVQCRCGFAKLGQRDTEDTKVA